MKENVESVDEFIHNDAALNRQDLRNASEGKSYLQFSAAEEAANLPTTNVFWLINLCF